MISNHLAIRIHLRTRIRALYSSLIRSALSALTTALTTAIALVFCAQVTWACGGLFCDNNQPINQAAERILFASSPTGEMQMHVQIQYQGPPDEFSWLLPVPRGTQIGLSRAALFPQLDQRYQPRFQLNRISPTYCPEPDGDFLFSATSESVDDRTLEPEVQVTSQSRVGPYDQVTLNAPNVEVLTEWLTENNYQVPPNAEETLTPYLEDYEFLALKLAAGRESGDIQPVYLLLPTEIATIPIRPTAVAAQPDMGVIIHLVGPTRAIPTNYQLVELNYAALDWFNPSNHYSQLVSHAVDQADEGRAFVTDFAGAHTFGVEQVIPILSPSAILAMEEVRDGEALFQVLSSTLSGRRHQDLIPLLVSALPLERDDAQMILTYAQEGTRIEREEVQSRLRADGGAGDWIEVDGGAIADEMRAYQVGGEALRQVFEDHPYITRLYTTLSASEMSVDPTFDFNADLDDVPQTRTADLHLTCDGARDYLVTADGLVVDFNDTSIETLSRQDGETVRAPETLGAATISRPMSVGQPELIVDYRPELRATYRRLPVDDSAGCEQRAGSHLIHLLISLTLLFGVTIRLRVSGSSKHNS